MPGAASSLMPGVADTVDGSAVAEHLRRRLTGRVAPRATVATERRASPGEGLALVAAFVDIADPELRQALLDTAVLLAKSPG